MEQTEAPRLTETPNGRVRKARTRQAIALGFAVAAVLSHLAGIAAVFLGRPDVAQYCVSPGDVMLTVGIVAGFYFGEAAALKRPGSDTES